MANKTARKETTSSVSFSDSNLICVIAKGTSIEGEFNTTENVRIDGTIKGNLQCDKKLVLGQSALIEGKLQANEAVIMGNIQGDVVVKGLLRLEGTAVIKGDITAQKIIVEEGARYDGISKIGG
jgi:cytoskeletal protein CcmA (bactofilin family)